MYTKFLIVLLLIFIVYNSQKLKEKFSNAFQDTEIRAKLSHFGTNLSEEKPLLTLYYDRREPNCKYFYDYFSKYYGGKLYRETDDGTGSTQLSEDIQIKNALLSIYEQAKDSTTDESERAELDEVMAFIRDNWPLGQEIPDDILSQEQKRILREKEREIEADIKYQKSRKHTGKSQAWNQFKAIYADTDDENKYIKPDFLNIEEVEVKDGELYDFNSRPAYKIQEDDKVGYVQYVGDKPKEYKQYYKPDNFLDRIPKLVLSFFKHKSKEDIETIIKNLSVEYANLKHFHKYDFYVIEYDGLYSPNNRQIKTTLNNIIQFINETYDEYLLCPNQESHYSRIGSDKGHQFESTAEKYIKCKQCSEFIKNED